MSDSIFQIANITRDNDYTGALLSKLPGRTQAQTFRTPGNNEDCLYLGLVGYHTQYQGLGRLTRPSTGNSILEMSASILNTGQEANARRPQDLRPTLPKSEPAKRKLRYLPIPHIFDI